MNTSIVAQIAKSGLKPAHILVIFFFAYFAMLFALRMGADAGWWPRSSPHGEIAVRAGAILVGVAMFACLREARGAMAAMFRAPCVAVRPSDLLLALALTVSWCLGVHAVLVKYPTIWMEPDQYLRFWGYQAASPQWTPSSLALVLVGTSVLIPVLEEFYFRGMLFTALRVRRTLLASILLSSVAFGVVHGRTTVLAFGFGVIAALMFLRYRSLWPPIAVHAAYNALVNLPGTLSLMNRKSLAQASAPGSWAIEIVLAAAFIPLAILFWRRFRPVEETLPQ